MRTSLLILILISFKMVSGQNPAGKTFEVKRDYHDAWLTFYANEVYRFSSSAYGRTCADSGKYSIKEGTINFVSIYSDQMGVPSKKPGMFINIIAPINSFKLKIISDSVLVQRDKEFRKYKKEQKTWRRSDKLTNHPDIRTYRD